MSGHSKWSQIKRQKGVADHRRGQAFTKLGYAITIAAREGGGDPAANFKLRLAIEKARAANMPKDNIDRAVKRGTGELGGVAIEELLLEGFGPGGTAVMVEAVTDNKNRTLGEIRRIFEAGGGKLGSAGAVRHLFEQRGVIECSAPADKLEEIQLAAIDAGASEVIEQAGRLVVQTQPQQTMKIKTALEAAGAKIESASLSYEPITMVVAHANSEAVQQLLSALDDHADVTEVYTNAEL